MTTTDKKCEKFKVLGIGWSLIEMLYGMCINGFEAWKFQNACRCHGNCKNTKFNTKVCVNMSDKISGKFHPIPSTIANQWWKSIRNIIIYLETKFRSNRRIFVFWRPLWIQSGHHSKPTMNINSQHHNLLGNQISPKSEDFCILAAIMDSKWPP
jgi:hypothetical protein